MSQFSQFHGQTENWDKLTPLEAKMKEIELLSQSIADGFVYFQKREKEMESTNGKFPKLFKWISEAALEHKKQKVNLLNIRTWPVLSQTASPPWSLSELLKQRSLDVNY